MLLMFWCSNSVLLGKLATYNYVASGTGSKIHTKFFAYPVQEYTDVGPPYMHITNCIKNDIALHRLLKLPHKHNDLMNLDFYGIGQYIVFGNM